MCATYKSPQDLEIERLWQIRRLDGWKIYPPTAFPGYLAPIALLNDGEPSWTVGQFGLLPHWCKPDAAKKLARSTYNARAETVFEKPSYKTAWKHKNLCIIPAAEFYEPNYESGKPERWRIVRKDGQPILIAGIHWNWKNTDTGEYHESFSMLTINADDHPVMKRFHAPTDEKRSVVMLDDQDKEKWLRAESHDEARTFFRAYSPDLLIAEKEL